MHSVHHTEGIILAASDSGEADRMLTIFTRDHGKLAVFARSVRLEKSKLRYHLRPFARVRLSFIEGKDILRLTDAEELTPPPSNEKAWHAAKKIAVFANRLIAGQERDGAVWDLFAAAFGYLVSARAISPAFEPTFKARLLNRLGYLENESANVEDIEEALSASQL